MSTYTPPSRIAQITLAKSSDVNAISDATAIAFGLLPNEDKLKQNTVTYAVDTGVANAYVVTIAGLAAYTDGLMITVKPLNSNTDISTINLNGLGARSIRLANSEPIQAGDIIAGAPIQLIYSSTTTYFHLSANSAVYAAEAAASAVAAANSASAASTSASNAATSASNAAGSASTASTQASNASTSASAASTSASNAATSATNAAGSATTASTQASNASTSASAASTSASNAATSATNAASSASTASTQASNASSSASSALSYLNLFKGQYYGALSADPTLDPLGNPMGTGDLYWNTTSNIMKVYDGSAWQATYLPASGYLALTGGTLTGALSLTDNILSRAMFKDIGYSYYNSGTTNALDYTNGSHQRWTPNTGAQTLSITNWSPTGNLSELLIEGVNLGAATITWGTINWIKSDGSTTTTFSSNGVTLQTSGTDWVLLWTRDAGTTIYGKVVR